MEKEFILNVENLNKIGACQEGINFIKNNGFIGLNYYALRIKGDFHNFKFWLDQALKNEYTYDVKGNLLSKTFPDGGGVTYTYDKKGNKLSTIDKKGDIWKYTYDNRGNMLSKIFPNGEEVKYIYDKKGNKLSTINPSGCVCEYTYDNKNNILSETSSSGYNCERSYIFKKEKLIKISRNNEIICEIVYKKEGENK